MGSQKEWDILNIADAIEQNYTYVMNQSVNESITQSIIDIPLEKFLF